MPCVITVKKRMQDDPDCKSISGYGVCAADLAGAESLYPMSEFMELFKKTKALGMPFTLHAGECGSVQNILDSVEAGAGRIGHGIAMRGMPIYRKNCRKKASVSRCVRSAICRQKR